MRGWVGRWGRVPMKTLSFFQSGRSNMMCSDNFARRRHNEQKEGQGESKAKAQVGAAGRRLQGFPCQGSLRETLFAVEGLRSSILRLLGFLRRSISSNRRRR